VPPPGPFNQAWLGVSGTEFLRLRPVAPSKTPRTASGILPVMMIGVGLDARLGLPFDQLRAAAREAERLGFESLWTPAGGVPDAFHICAAWLQDTSLRTGISVVPAVRMWTPLGLAAQAATLAQLSSGRFVLGLGTGGYGPGFWASVGLPDRPIAVMREYVTEVRGLVAGQQVTAGPIVAREGTSPVAPGWPRSASLGLPRPAPAPVYLAALGPQMLRLAGEIADGALLNWATPERIAVSRAQVDAGAARTGRDPGAVPMTMYIRVCVDDDVAAARRAFGAQVLGYAMGRPGIPQGVGYRGLFAQMGFDAELSELEQRRDQGAAMPELVAAAPDEMLQAVGYYGPAAPAAAAFARLSAGLDEAIVRIVTARPGLEPVREAMAALTPSRIRNATQTGS
jgi:alkanesulfonate monooxygenase SsuD/methylene tetrahydromethanopterin reductase-like flavin-dependent oxidoreductase (luciferase family)